MSHSRRIEPVGNCIKYIERCGWKLEYYNRPWYVFKSSGTARTLSGGSEITFTLTELRHAFNYGW